jgi:hypothetical protein
MNIKLLVEILTNPKLLLEFSPKIRKQLQERWKEEILEYIDEDYGAEWREYLEEIINEYLDRFLEIKDRFEKKDPFQYTWTELTEAVHKYTKPELFLTNHVDVEEATLVREYPYVENGQKSSVKVFLADSPKTCAHFAGTRKGYSFCIRNPDTFKSYSERFSAFYYVVKEGEMYEDPTHLTVIMTGGKGTNSDVKFGTTFAPNGTLYPSKSDQEIIQQFDNQRRTFVNQHSSKANSKNPLRIIYEADGNLDVLSPLKDNDKSEVTVKTNLIKKTEEQIDQLNSRYFGISTIRDQAGDVTNREIRLEKESFGQESAEMRITDSNTYVGNEGLVSKYVDLLNTTNGSLDNSPRLQERRLLGLYSSRMRLNFHTEKKFFQLIMYLQMLDKKQAESIKPTLIASQVYKAFYNSINGDRRVLNTEIIPAGRLAKTVAEIDNFSLESLKVIEFKPDFSKLYAEARKQASGLAKELKKALLEEVTGVRRRSKDASSSGIKKNFKDSEFFNSTLINFLIKKKPSIVTLESLIQSKKIEAGFVDKVREMFQKQVVITGEPDKNVYVEISEFDKEVYSHVGLIDKDFDDLMDPLQSGAYRAKNISTLLFHPPEATITNSVVETSLCYIYFADMVFSQEDDRKSHLGGDSPNSVKKLEQYLKKVDQIADESFNRQEALEEEYLNAYNDFIDSYQNQDEISHKEISANWNNFLTSLENLLKERVNMIESAFKEEYMDMIDDLLFRRLASCDSSVFINNLFLNNFDFKDERVENMSLIDKGWKDRFLQTLKDVTTRTGAETAGLWTDFTAPSPLTEEFTKRFLEVAEKDEGVSIPVVIFKKKTLLEGYERVLLKFLEGISSNSLITFTKVPSKYNVAQLLKQTDLGKNIEAFKEDYKKAVTDINRATFVASKKLKKIRSGKNEN